MTTPLNQIVRHLFKVVDLASAPVTGLVTGSFTLTLQSGLPGSLASASETVTISEEGSGYYWATYTPEREELYQLDISEGVDIVAPDSFQVVVVGPSAVVGPYFTTLARVKQAMFPGVASPPSSYDGLITAIIAEVTGEIRQKLDNRYLFERTNVEYLDGDGTARLLLREGPLDTVASVYSVAYSDDGAGNMVETLTLVKASEYVLWGLRDDDWLGRGWVERLGACWECGQRNFKVTYDAGFAAIPATLGVAALNKTLSMINQRPGLSQVWVGDYRAWMLDPEKVDRAVEISIAPLNDWNLA